MSNSSFSWKKNAFLVLKGAGIGMANVIPGVSGGTVALLLGIYNELTEAVGNFLTASWKQKWQYLLFLIPLAIGGAAAILVFARILEWLYTAYPQQVGFFFLGLVAAGFPALLKNLDEKPGKTGWLLFALAFAGTLALGIMDRQTVRADAAQAVLPSLSAAYAVKLFVSGLLAAASMVVPGISGSFVMLLLSEYHNIIGFINAMNLPVLGIFALGAIAGLVAVARLINMLLNRFKEPTMMAILGLVLASLYVIWPGITWSILPLTADLLLFAAGGFIVWRFARVG